MHPAVEVRFIRVGVSALPVLDASAAWIWPESKAALRHGGEAVDEREVKDEKPNHHQGL